MADRKSDKELGEQYMISVIVPVYNAEKYLAQCIESILAQTYSEIELILVNDGSTDGSGHICDTYQRKDHRVTVIHAENGGVSKARNIGMAHATGKYIAFVDADDYILQTMYEKLHNAMTDKDIAFCRFAYAYPEKTVLQKEQNFELLVKRPFDYSFIMVDRYSRDEGDTIVCDKIHGSVCRQLFRRKIILENRIQFKENVKIAEDRLFLLEYLNYCDSAAFVDEYLYRYRMENPHSATKVFHKYRTDLPESQKLLVTYQQMLLKKNTKLSRKEKRSLEDFLKCRACYAIVLNEIKYNRSNATQNLNQAFRDSFFRKALTLRCLITMKRDYKTPYKTVAFYWLIILRQWKLIGRLLK